MSKLVPPVQINKRLLLLQTLSGAAIGMLIAALALIVFHLHARQPWTFGAILRAHVTNRSSWAIYLAPLMLGLLSYELGRRRLIEAELRRQRDFFQRVINTLGEGVTVTELDGGFSFVNNAYAQIVGLPADEVETRTPFDVVIPEDHHVLQRALLERREGLSSIYEVRVRRAGRLVHAKVHAAPHYRDGKLEGAIAVITDVTKYKELERALRQQHEFALTIIETVQSLIVVLNQQGELIYFNRACEMLTGYQRDEVLGSIFWDIFLLTEDVARVQEIFANLDTGDVSRQYENYWRLRDGSTRLIQWSNALVRTPDDIYVIATGNDITEHRWLEQRREELILKLHDQATTDSLTALHNRGHFFTLSQEALDHALENAATLAALMLDIDHFKQINDGHGHAIGDEVLRVVADRCRRSLRDGDIIGRYGGEELGILLPGGGGPDGATIAERLRLAIASSPIHTAAGPIAVTISIGVAELRGERWTLGELLNHADTALYKAKRSGRNCVVIGGGPPLRSPEDHFGSDEDGPAGGLVLPPPQNYHERPIQI